jgi:hypothetical protein
VLLQVILKNGGVGERLKPAVLKTVRPERASGVRIPPPPPLSNFGVREIAPLVKPGDCPALYHGPFTTVQKTVSLERFYLLDPNESVLIRR